MQNSFLATETIRAAHNLTIEHNSRVWRLYNGTRGAGPSGTRIALLDADATQILCEPSFAEFRRLSQSALSPSDIARVVVGWAPESHSWHLGLLLAAQPDTDYKPRWCGLASWPSGEPYTHLGDAQDAGQSLARIINRPFHLIPAKSAASAPITGDTQPIETTRPMASQGRASLQAAPAPVVAGVASSIAQPEPIAVQPPPIAFDGWVLREIPAGYALKRRPQWIWSTLGRAVGFLVLTLLYLVLGIGTQVSGLASVKPDWLPWMGLVVALVLTGMGLRQFWLLLNVADMIVDTHTRDIRMQQRLSGHVRWRLSFDSVAYVLVSQTPARPQGLKRQSSHTSTVQDIWLHLSDGTQFYPVLAVEDSEGVSHQWDITRQRQKTAGRRKLRLAHYDTALHHAAHVLADTLKVDLWLDIR